MYGLPLLALVLLISSSSAPARAIQIYWADIGADRIRGAAPGGAAATLLDDVGVQNVAIDDGRLYFTDVFLERIRRIDLDGTGLTDLLDTGSAPVGLALDPGGQRMFWSDTMFGWLYRADLDGSNAGSIVQGQFINANDLAYDEIDDLVFWADGHNDSGRGVWRAAGDGTDVVRVRDTLPLGLALDPELDRLYWSETSGIWRAGLDGSDAELLIGATDVLDVELFGGRIYWGTFDLDDGGAILSADLAGSDVRVEVFAGFDIPWSIAVVPEPSTGLLLAGGLLALVATRRS